ncbi:rhomboid family intramembrane serine protease [Rhodalgimonas zhirmunskyi]|uniref:Rhomboid family intramembrane serine protease n=1 Tax=Rhodalgimonas zhirmunskyi TaxID=2964767 RepID=A0AAJ1U7Z3_9RHOB|nr:rhomboid family intramembrane serine protease [Rhodoalgimonas zhirmunskyi]MDQ2094634.1 rhomboid family intramembrane serine protease [Rhodoalgimonas zhirmunskyi]
MFPIRDHNPSGRTPYVTYALIVVNVVVFLATLGIEQNSRALMQFYFDWAIIPARVEAGEGFYTLITSMFLHAGFMHIAGNMLFLWIFGDNLEDIMGHVGFLIFYLLAGTGAGLVHVMMSPASLVPTVGASGAIAAVMGGYLLLFPKAKIDILVIFIIFFKIFTIPAWIMLAIWFAIQFFGGLAADPDAGGVAYWAHAGGFVLGAILALPVFLRRGGPAFWNRTHGLPPHPAAHYDPSRIPTVRRSVRRRR